MLNVGTPPATVEAKSPKRMIRERTDKLLAVLDILDGDSLAAWFSVLRAHVVARDSDGRFSDVLADPRMAEPTLIDCEDILAGTTVAEISVLYEFLLANQDMTSKRDKGQFFTPDDVARFMAAKALTFGPGTWLDPCCGVGNLTYWLIAAQGEPERFLLDSCRFLDLDDVALFTARVLMAISFQENEESLFTRLEPNFRRGDFLADSLTEPPPFDHSFDFVLMNPPYVQTTDNSGRFASVDSRDLYAFFLEHAMVNSRGVVAITPQTLTNGARHKALRRVILDNADVCEIYCFDNVPDTIFRGFKHGSENSNHVNSTRAAVTVARKDSQQTKQQIRITPLVRWRATERAAMFREVDEMLASPIGVEAALFPKIAPGLEDFYSELTTIPTTVGDLAIKGPSEYSLHVPTTPRYFISATERDLSRSSIATLYFETEHAKRLAYLTLNSSIAYFWWRVRDGGMTLSRQSLLSVPLDETTSVTSARSRTLIAALQKSEIDNLVGKMNAGKNNENVKHPLALIQRVTEYLAPTYGDRLIRLHQSSSLAEPGHTN